MPRRTAHDRAQDGVSAEPPQAVATSLSYGVRAGRTIERVDSFVPPGAFDGRPIPGGRSRYGCPTRDRWVELRAVSVPIGPDHQVPVLAIEAQGSAGASAAPFCSSSMETPSGERMKAMYPSRGGRLMVTPSPARRAQTA
jgi:hypothetical protein